MVRSTLLVSAAALVALLGASAVGAQSPVPIMVVPCSADASEQVDAFRYPRLAQKYRRDGSVYLRVLVSDKSEADTVAVSTSSGSPHLDRAARIGARNVTLCERDAKTRAAPGYAQMRVNFKMTPLLIAER